jgi:hypothetical protein
MTPARHRSALVRHSIAMQHSLGIPLRGENTVRCTHSALGTDPTDGTHGAQRCARGCLPSGRSEGLPLTARPKENGLD